MLQKFVSTQVQRVMIGALAAAALAAPASAATVVFKNVTGEWMNAEPYRVTDLDYDHNPGAHAAVYWGDPAQRHGDQSGYEFDAVSPGKIYLGGARDEAGPFKLGQFTHVNEPITGTSLTSIDFRFTTDIWVDDVNQGTYSFDWTFFHDETPNDARRCAYNPSYLSNVNSNGCADRVSVDFKSDNNSFQVGDQIYTFDLAGFLVKDKHNDWVQKDVFYTKEEKENTAYILGSLSVRDAPIVSIPDVPGVPEPATWAMLIMGFGGIGSVMRRQRRVALAAA